MKQKFILSIVLLSSAATSQAALIAAWNFNTLSITTASTPGSGGVPTSISASSGTGTVGLSTWGGNIDDFGGSTINQVGSEAAEKSLSLIAGTSNAGNNTFITVSFSTVGFEDIILSYAHSGTGTAFNAGGWSWSTDGTNFTALAGSPVPTRSAFSLATANFASISNIENTGSVTLRYTLSGATSSSANNRIDNLQINATAIPETSTTLLGAIGVLALLRRRR
jgi:hypothetical protein